MIGAWNGLNDTGACFACSCSSDCAWPFTASAYCPAASRFDIVVWPLISCAFAPMLRQIALRRVLVSGPNLELPCLSIHWYMVANQSPSVGSRAILPFHFGLARSAKVRGTSPACTRFVFHARTNFSIRSAVKVRKRKLLRTFTRNGDFVYGTSTFVMCWNSSIVVPFVSTMSPPFECALRSASTFAVTSSLEPRKRLTLTFGYAAVNALTSAGALSEVSEV